MNIDDIRRMADDIAGLMLGRFGGLRKDEVLSLPVMLRRRGGALPARERRAARLLARAYARTAQPKVAHQLDFQGVEAAYQRLQAYLAPMGREQHWKRGWVRNLASFSFGLMIVAALFLWILIWRGLV